MHYKDINLQIGSRIKEKRRVMNYSREALSEIVEISPQFLANIESGKKGMSFTTLAKLSRALAVSCDYIILGKEEAPDQCRINELISNMNPKYIPIAEEMLADILKIVSIAKKE